jgi:flagellar motor switch protein FliN/FliY
MAIDPAEQAHTTFAQAFCAAFQESLAALCGASWQVSTVDTLLAPAASDEASIEYCLTLSGNLTGSVFVVFDRTEAVVLAAVQAAPAKKGKAAPARDYSEVLADIVHGAAEALPQRLEAARGSFKVEVAHALAPDPSAVHRAQLLAVNDEGRSASVRLFFTPELSDALEPPRAAAEAPAKIQGNLNLVMDVELNVTLRFGQRQLSLREILDLGSGSVVELDRLVDEPVELILDGRVIARGEAVIIDGNYGVRVTEVLESMPA